MKFGSQARPSSLAMGIFKGDVSGALRGLMGKQARRSWSKVGWRLLRSVLFIYGSVALYLFFFADRMIFLPPAPSYEHTPQDDSTAITLTSADGDRKSTRLNSSHVRTPRMPSSAWKKKFALFFFIQNHQLHQLLLLRLIHLFFKTN